MLKTIIVEDELQARQSLKAVIDKYLPNIEIVEEADGVSQAVRAITEHNPDLVFFDIELKDGTSFEVLEQLKSVNFKIIFITGFSEFAVKAFKFSALDYLLKPINSNELVRAVERAENEIKLSAQSMKLDVLLSNIKSSVNEPKKIILKTQDFIHLISVHTIVYCQSDNSYVTFFLNTGKKILVSATMKEYEELLEDYGFFRVHQSYLVNINFISRFDKREGGFIVMNNESTVPVSQRKRQELIQLFEKM